MVRQTSAAGFVGAGWSASFVFWYPCTKLVMGRTSRSTAARAASLACRVAHPPPTLKLPKTYPQSTKQSPIITPNTPLPALYVEEHTFCPPKEPSHVPNHTLNTRN